MKKYLDFEGLSVFFEKLSALFEQKADKEDIKEIANDEIDEICSIKIYAGSEVEL